MNSRRLWVSLDQMQMEPIILVVKGTIESESESRSVVFDSSQPPWTRQSMEFSRPENWSE